MDEQVKQIELSSVETERTFLFQHSFSYITLKRIIFNSLIGQDIKVWTGIVNNLSLEFRLKDGFNTTRIYPLDFISYISLDQIQPVIVFREEFIVPKENKDRFTSTMDYIKELSILLRSKSNNPMPHDLRLTILYETNPGVQLVQNYGNRHSENYETLSGVAEP